MPCSAAFRLLPIALLAAACNVDPPGDEIGTYKVRMSLRENTCGASAVHLQDNRSYTAQLRADDSRGYWRLPGQQPIVGRYEDGDFEFTFESAVASSAPDAGAYCQLIQSEKLAGSVVRPGAKDAGADADADGSAEDATVTSDTVLLQAEHVLTISAAPGTDCSEALAPVGPFLQLPCTLRYALTGTEAKSF